MPLALMVDMTGAYYYVFDRIGWGSNYPHRSLFCFFLQVLGVCGPPGRVLNCIYPVGAKPGHKLSAQVLPRVCTPFL